MLSEIGSNFWIYPGEMRGEIKSISPSIFNCKGSDYVWLSTGRSAISYVIKTIEERLPNIRKTVCLPSFTCHTVFEPFVKAGYQVHTLPIDCRMCTTVDDILKVVKDSNASVLLLHRYFGFDTLPGIDTIIPELREMGVIVIEDCTQSMYSEFSRIDADYHIGSIRKWCGVPDGGFAVCRDGVFNNKPLTYDHKLEAKKREASESKYRYLFKFQGEKKDFLSYYREAEDILSQQDCMYTISELSNMVQNNLDIADMKQRRKDNFRVLLSGLSKIKGIKPVFEYINDQETPLYFPIVCEDRSFIQSLLVKNAIYAPIVWPKDKACPDACDVADYFYDNLLCIPIDQRYKEDDMMRIISVLRNDPIEYGWMSWEELAPYKEQLVDMEHELMIRYHYPDWDIPRSYPKSRVDNLETHLNSGNTHFWGIRRGPELLGYTWVYTSQFIDKLRLNRRASFIKESIRSNNFGKILFEQVEIKAKELCCDEISTSYVPSNGAMEHLTKKNGFEISRIEVVKKLK